MYNKLCISYTHRQTQNNVSICEQQKPSVQNALRSMQIR